MSVTSPRTNGVTSPRPLHSARRHEAEPAADVSALAREIRLLKHHLQQEEAQHRQTRQQLQQAQEKCARLEQHSRSLESAHSGRAKPDAKGRLWTMVRRSPAAASANPGSISAGTPRSPSPTPSCDSHASGTGSALGIDHARLHETEFAHLRERLLHSEREAEKAREESRALRDELRKTLKAHEAERSELQRIHAAEIARLAETERRQRAQDAVKAEAAEKDARRREKDLDREIERLKSDSGRALAEKSRRIEQDQSEIVALSDMLRSANAKVRALEAEFAELARESTRHS